MLGPSSTGRKFEQDILGATHNPISKPATGNEVSVEDIDIKLQQPPTKAKESLFPKKQNVQLQHADAYPAVKE